MGWKGRLEDQKAGGGGMGSWRVEEVEGGRGWGYWRSGGAEGGELGARQWGG